MNIDQRIADKLRKGDVLTAYEIELLENKRIQKEKDYLFSNNIDDKHA